MKRNLLLLTIAAALVVPAVTRADDMKSKCTTQCGKEAVSQVHHTKKVRTYYFITNRTVVGSHIPVIIRREGTDLQSSAPVTTYTRLDLDRSGVDGIGAALVKTDPAITFARSR